MSKFLEAKKQELKNKTGKKRVTQKELALYVLFNKYSKVKSK